MSRQIWQNGSLGDTNSCTTCVTHANDNHIRLYGTQLLGVTPLGKLHTCLKVFKLEKLLSPDLHVFSHLVFPSLLTILHVLKHVKVI